MTTTNNQKYFPMLVPSSRGAVDSSEDIVARWGKFRSLPEESRKMLTSKEMNELLHRYEREYSLSEDVVEDFSRSVRKLFFGDVDQNAFLGWLVSVTGARQEQVTEIYNSIVSIIPTEDDDMGDEDEIVSTEEAREYESLSLRDGAKQFPGIGEQLLSEEALKLSDGREVRPSVANWVRLYRAKLGVSRHGTMERGNFLFHDSNTQHLDSSERRRLATVLKSLDEETNLLIDPELQTIVFVDRVSDSSQYSEIGDNVGSVESGVGSEDQKVGRQISVKQEDEHEARPSLETQTDLGGDNREDHIQQTGLQGKAEPLAGEEPAIRDEGRAKLERMVTEATLDDAGVHDWKPSSDQQPPPEVDQPTVKTTGGDEQSTDSPVMESDEVRAESEKESPVASEEEESYSPEDSIQVSVPPQPEPVSEKALQSVKPGERVGASILEDAPVPATVRKSWTSGARSARDQFSVFSDQGQPAKTQEDTTVPATEEQESEDDRAHPVSWETDEGIEEMPTEPIFAGRRFHATTQEEDFKEEEPKRALRSSSAFENAFGVKAPIPMQQSSDKQQPNTSNVEEVEESGQVAVDRGQGTVDSGQVAVGSGQVAVDSGQGAVDSGQGDESVQVNVSKQEEKSEEEKPDLPPQEEEAVIPVTNETEEPLEEHTPEEHTPEEHAQQEMQYHMASIRPFSTRSRMSSRFSQHSHSHSNISETIDPDVFADETERFRRRIESRGGHRIGGESSQSDVATPEERENVVDMRFSSNQVFPAENDVDTVESVIETNTGEHEPSPNKVELT